MQSTQPIKRLTRNVKQIKFKGHIETWHSEKVDPKKNLVIPGRHVDEQGIIRDKNNFIVVATSPGFVGTKKLINTSLGMGKKYDTIKEANTVSIFTNW